ncbi:hypothetical protein [Nitratifractor sp.]
MLGEIKTKAAEELARYENYPCKRKVFSPGVKTVRVKHGDSYTTYTLYYITRSILHSLKDYEKYDISTPAIFQREYDGNASFRVLDLYYAHSYAGSSRYLLVKSEEDGSIAWLSADDFNHTTCRMLPTRNFDNPVPSGMKRIELDLGKMKKEEF